MSAIAAIFDSERSRSADALRRSSATMLEAIAHGGPDGADHWAIDGAALAHGAMHATAESRSSRQPLHDPESRFVIAMDGYLANYAEISRDLTGRGVQLRDASDAELILQAWRAMGSACLSRFDGEFAAIIVDCTHHEIHLLRDHMGLRPLFYHWDGTRLIAASHIAGVLAGLERQPELNRGFLAEIMAFTLVTPGVTVWQGVHRLLPAHCLTVSANGMAQSRYWSMPDGPSIHYRRESEYAEHYRALLTHCVQRAGRSDAPLGVECSGGLDSSAVFALADRLDRARQLPAPNIRGYTFATPPGSSADEIHYARAVAQHLERDLTEVPLFMPELSWFAEQSRADRDLPPYTNAAMSRQMQSAMVSDGCRAVLNGQGGDHFLDGNRFHYHEVLSRGQIATLVQLMAADLSAVGLGETARAFAHGGIAPLLPQALVESLKSLIPSGKAQSVNDAAELHDWIAPELRALLKERVERAQSPERYHLQYKRSKVTHPLNTHVLDAAARQAAQIGFEMRTPMMSRAFVEFFAATPEHIRLRGNETKRVHRKALSGYLPQTVLERQDKADFSITFERHLEALSAAMSADLSNGAKEVVNSFELQSLVRNYGSVSLDQVNSWNVWGTYAVMTLLNQVGR